MKRIAIIALAIAMLLLIACTPAQPAMQPTETTTIEVTTTTPTTTAAPDPSHIYEIQLYYVTDIGRPVHRTRPAMTDGTAEHILFLMWPNSEFLYWEIRGNTGHLGIDRADTPGMGGSHEFAFRAALGNTFLTFFGLEYIIFGGQIDFGHFCWGCDDDACFCEPFTYYAGEL